ncbi:MAG TPA: polysaccharide biosynthesis/export family protein [Pyrinomonadaceae bacterium]|nr:polysaccharide biosynthesis/export family protein [Pyrinomonadaceae bacterium]
MKKPFYKFVFFTIGAVLALPLSDSYAQQQQTTPNPPVAKRNSPFSPNPKKKAETVKKNTEEIRNTTAENPVANGNAGLTVNQSNNTSRNSENSEALPTENAGTRKTGNQTAEFESRSAAKKTLDIAKRNSANAQPTEIYKVGAGDVLDIRILNSPAKDSTLFTVLESGAIDYPLAGQEPLQVAGLTSAEIEDLLKEKVRLYENPQISVTVRDYASHTISVLGSVEKPGTKALRREAIPLYVIMAEAIPHPAANKATILRAGDKQTITVKLDDNETLIYPNDIIRVISGGGASGGQSQFYFIGGEIVSGGQKEFHDGLTLTQAILACGGLKKSSTRKVIIRRRDAQGKLVPTEFDLKFIKEGKIADPALTAGDTIEIGN